MSTYYTFNPSNRQLVLNVGNYQYNLSKIGIAVEKDGDSLILHKHGFPDIVKKWQQTSVAFFSDIVYLEVEPEAYTEINKMISTTGYTPESIKCLLT